MGTRTVPFYAALRGTLLPYDLGQEQERVAILFGPRVHPVQISVNIYPQPPVASYSNPKVSISSSPAFLYCIICTAYVLCFLGALARGLFL